SELYHRDKESGDDMRVKEMLIPKTCMVCGQDAPDEYLQPCGNGEEICRYCVDDLEREVSNN
ncbi:hypothetical protein ABND49_22120, partial [Paenibacillus larvae]